MGYIFSTFNKLTYMLIIHVCIYTYICVCHKNHGYSMEYRGIPLAPPMTVAT